jgi:hypothetical protein
MARINFRIQPSAKTMSQLSNGVKKEGSKAMAARALTNAATISKDIGLMLVAKFNSSIVARSLRGQGSTDLSSHFGLSDSQANSLADGMSELIRKSVRIIGSSAPGSTSIRIQAVEKDWSQYLSLPGAQYVSKPSNITIPVVRWLLIDPSIDIGQAAYDIVFEGEGGQFDARIQKVSRSGRAIMVSLDSLGGSGGYVLPSIIAGQSGQNFIEYTLGQKDVAEKAAAILIKRVK